MKRIEAKDVTNFIRNYEGLKPGRVYKQKENLKLYGQMNANVVASLLRMKFPGHNVFIEYNDDKWRKTCKCCGQKLDIGDVYISWSQAK